MIQPQDLFKKRKEIGDRLKNERIKKGLSVLYISKLSGMNRSTIHNIEGGKAGARLDVLLIYELILNTTP